MLAETSTIPHDTDEGFTYLIDRKCRLRPARHSRCRAGQPALVETFSTAKIVAHTQIASAVPASAARSYKTGKKEAAKV